jgi:putative ABC transport system permease protein
MDGVTQDLRYAVGSFRQSPGFVLIAVLTLALGIAASTAIFTVIDNLFFTPPTFRDVDRLVYIVDSNPEKVPSDAEPSPSPGNVLDWRERARSFEYIAMWRNWYYAVREIGPGAAAPESVRGVRVSPTFFRMLGVDAALGRTFAADEGVVGHDRVVVLTHGLWIRRFGADPAIIGRQILVDAQPVTVVGVLPQSFQFYQPDLDLWMPLAEDAALHDRANHSVLVFARLAANVALSQAQRELDGITRQLAQEYPDTNAGWGTRVLPLYPSREVRDVRPALIILLSASSVVLLIACVNVANLLLGRGLARQRELAIRAAIGATRGRLIRQMLTESLLLGVAGSAISVVVAEWAVRLLVPLLPHAGTNQVMGTFGPMGPSLDLRVVAFTVSAAILTGALFGVAPAVQTTRGESLRLRSSASHRGQAGQWLMAAELALAIVLLVGAALLVKSFWRLQTVDPGFGPDHLLTIQLWLPKTMYADADRVRRFYKDLLARIEGLPGVRTAGAVSFRPFLGMAMTTRVDVPGRRRTADDDVVAGYDIVTPNYLRLLGQRLLRGRDIADTDTERSPGVAVINETMARQLWPNDDPIGRPIRPDFSRTDVPWAIDADTRVLTVVGVAADIKEFRLNERPRPLMYISHQQFPSSYMHLVIRTDIRPESLTDAVLQQIHALDPDEPVSNIRTMDAAMDQAMPRFNVALLGVFATIAWVLATIGVYGVTAHAVAQRTREIGIRMALGASTRDMLSMVIGDTFRVGAIGAAVGIVGALGVGRAMMAILYGVAPTDGDALVAAVLALVVALIAATLVPARCAARVAPIEALRTE